MTYQNLTHAETQLTLGSVVTKGMLRGVLEDAALPHWCVYGPQIELGFGRQPRDGEVVDML